MESKELEKTELSLDIEAISKKHNCDSFVFCAAKILENEEDVKLDFGISGSPVLLGLSVDEISKRITSQIRAKITEKGAEFNPHDPL